MKRFFKFSFILVLLLVVTGCGTNRDEYLVEISYDEFQEMLDNEETFILEVMRTDCSACMTFKPRISAVANDYEVEVKFINTDHLSDDDKKAIEVDYGVSGTPTVIFFIDGKEETVAARINGSVSEEKIISKFKASGFIEEE